MRIKEKRIEKGLTQEQLADLVGVTQGSVAQWESGLTTPRVQTLVAVAKALDCSTDDLIGGIDDETADHRASG